MTELGLETRIVDRTVYDRTVTRFRDAHIMLPTFAQLAEPSGISASVRARLAEVDPDAANPLNLFRVHWYNDASRTHQAQVPEHVVLPPALTGVPARIIVALGDRFPMIRAHKVLAAYGCLAPRVVSGQFDPTSHKALWPSTGNYCRGGVAISRIMGCRGVAILPEGMSAERFRWLDQWVVDSADIIRTPGSESNVKEIYDACNVLGRDPANVIFNQFCEFGNHLAHYLCTGRALGQLYETLRQEQPRLALRAFVSATGSAGTLAAGDYLKEQYGSRTVAVEALECPTMLYNGFGEHNIQGIGDKHIPLIHNVMNTDLVVAVSDASTDTLGVLFNTDVGQDYLRQRRAIPAGALQLLPAFGLSSICNVVAAIKTAKALDLGEDDAIVTVATDGAAMYASERDKAIRTRFDGRFEEREAAETFARHLAGVTTDHMLELSHIDQTRISNLGYFTWVEQQALPLADFTRRQSQEFWRGLRDLLPVWDEMITELNARVAAR